MKPINSEKLLTTDLRLPLAAAWIIVALMLVFSNGAVESLHFHPLLKGIVSTEVHISTAIIVCLRLALVIASSLLAWVWCTRNTELPRKDLSVGIGLALVHFSAPDWTTGLFFAFYWTFFLLILHLLTPGDLHRPFSRRVMTAGILSGFLLLNGADGLLFFFAGISILLIWNQFTIRNFLILIMGFLVPLSYLIFYYYLSDQWELVRVLPELLANTGQLFQPDFPIWWYGLPGLLLMLIAAIHLRLSEFKISVRRSISSLSLAVIIISPALISAKFSHTGFFLLSLSAVIYWSKSLYIVRNRFWFYFWLLTSLLLPILILFSDQLFPGFNG